MNTREYIESGTLDLYAAGLLSVEEMRDVELKSCQYPEIKTELQALQSSLENYAMKHAMIPPSGVKERILKRVEDEGENDKKKKTIVREISASKLSYTKYAVAASIALLIVAAGMAIFFTSQRSQYKQQISELTQQQSSMQNEMSVVKGSLTNAQEQIAVMADPNTIKISMKGTPISLQSLAMIFWNKESKSVYLNVKNLPINPSGKQYQLWFINSSNKPVSAGVFDAREEMFIKMIDAPDAVAFAVTLEPKGGSVNPTMDQMYVIGKVNS